ncbi:hypothetical protein [Brevibacterium album]|uniref:hypothetical protein n=1 Tax=Brevibacterium album TaxID=417948 RepID=UPI0004272C35|nr:hypothetical protein [Brevibacterium album]
MDYRSRDAARLRLRRLGCLARCGARRDPAGKRQRDLAFGTKGADVEALQDELVRQGKSIEKSGWFDWATWNAYREIAMDAGITVDYGQLALNEVLWLPQAKTAAASCPIRLGQRVVAGDALASLPTPVLAASVKSWPTDLVPGERTLSVSGTELAISEDGRVTGDQVLAALAQTEAYMAYAANPEGGQVSGEPKLVEPITVYPVPTCCCRHERR